MPLLAAVRKAHWGRGKRVGKGLPVLPRGAPARAGTRQRRTGRRRSRRAQDSGTRARAARPGLRGPGGLRGRGRRRTTHGAAGPAGILRATHGASLPWLWCGTGHGTSCGTGDPCRPVATGQMALSAARPRSVRRIPVDSPTDGTAPCTSPPHARPVPATWPIPKHSASPWHSTSPRAARQRWPCAGAAPAAFQIKPRSVPAHPRWHPAPKQPGWGGPGSCRGRPTGRCRPVGYGAPAPGDTQGSPSPHGAGDHGRVPAAGTAQAAGGGHQPARQDGAGSGAPRHLGCWGCSGTPGTQHRPGQTVSWRHQLGTLLGRGTSRDGHAGSRSKPGGGWERRGGGQQASHEPGPGWRELLNKPPLSGRRFEPAAPRQEPLPPPLPSAPA